MMLSLETLEQFHQGGIWPH